MEGIVIGDFDTVQDFVFYAEAHYLPLLERLSREGSEITDRDRNLLAFLHADMTSFCSNFD